MLKIPSKRSLYLSIALSVIFSLVCIAGAFIMPTLAEMLINAKDSIGSRGGDITETGRAFVLVLAYLVLAIVMLADVLLFFLLMRVRNGNVFTSQSVALIRGVAWCCLILALVFLGLGIYFQLALIVAFLAAFLGLSLRVVKNVIEEATEIKSENDLTV